MLCQSLHAQFAASGIHVVHVVIDGAVDAPDTLGRALGPTAFAALKATTVLIDPTAVAETYYYLAHQPRSCWTHELDVRAYTDRAWWSSAHANAIAQASKL
jgi:hypothetical protein